MTQPTPDQIAAELARVKAFFQLRALVAHMGFMPPATLTPPPCGLAPASSEGDRE